MANAQDAIELLTAASKKFKQADETLLLRIAEMYAAESQFDKAQDWLAQLEKSVAHRQVNNAGQRVGLLDQARLLLEAAIHLEQGDVFRCIALAQPLAAAGDGEQNVPLRAWGLLGRAYSRLGQWDLAAQSYEQVVRLAPIRYAIACWPRRLGWAPTSHSKPSPTTKSWRGVRDSVPFDSNLPRLSTAFR